MKPRNALALRDLLRAIALGRRNDAIQALDDMTPWAGWRELAADAIGPRLVDALLEYRHEILDEMEAVLAELRGVPAPVDAD